MKSNETANYTVVVLEQTTVPSQCDINDFTESNNNNNNNNGLISVHPWYGSSPDIKVE